jgi:predicted pyridoxine 5'-phosphate oxidase superfamily flavin-nucleotide-binding protein
MRKRMTPLIVFAALLAYAAVRYHLFKGVSWSHAPVYVTNKAVALMATLLLAAAVGSGPAGGVTRANRQHRRRLGMWALAMATLHVLLSLATLTPVYHARLYRADGWTLDGELALLTGSVGFTALLAQGWLSLARGAWDDGAQRRLGMRWVGWIAVGLVAVHCAAWGWRSWLAPGDWPGTLPPLTMLGFAVALVALVSRLAGRQG